MVECYNMCLNSSAETHPHYNPMEFDFDTLSNKTEGLSKLNPENIISMAYKRDDINDIAYTFTFINDTEYFQKVIEDKAKNFKKMSSNSKEKIVKLANTFKNVIEVPAEIYELSEVNANQEGRFIAYLNQGEYFTKQPDQRIHLMWKNMDDEKLRLFDELLKETKLSFEDFPDYLRTSGFIKTEIEHKSSVDNKYVLHVKFYGDSSNTGIHYAPKLLENSYSKIIDVFKRKNLANQIILEF